jgi:uncharacterized protein YdiU (UPF0061 family)
MMPQMLEFVIKNHYPEIYETAVDGKLGQQQYLLLFEEVVKRTAKMVALW